MSEEIRRRPAFGDNPDVDIVRIAAASSMQRLERERDAFKDAADYERKRVIDLTALAKEIVSKASILTAYDDTGELSQLIDQLAEHLEGAHQ